MSAHPKRGANQHMHGMTPRETQVMDMLESGMSRREIASALGLSYATVSNITGMYDFNVVLRTGDAFDRMSREGTMALERAILATGKRHS